MKRDRQRQRILAEINITPFTDVILVLLIIFIVATPLLLESNISVRLPKTVSAQPLTDTEQFYITITNESLVYLNKDLVTRKELKERMKVLHQRSPDRPVLLRADKSVRFENIVDVFDTLSAVGVKNLNIAGMPVPQQ